MYINFYRCLEQKLVDAFQFQTIFYFRMDILNIFWDGKNDEEKKAW